MIVIDRFEGDIAVLETDIGMVDVQRNILPENASEGDVIAEVNGAYIIDNEATEARRAAVRAKYSRLRRRGND